jgi:hypothetical protein
VSKLSTFPESDGLEAARRGSVWRRVFMLLLALHLLLALLFVYGPKTREVSASGAGYELTVRYASRSRPGLAAPWSVEIRRDGAFRNQPITVSTTSSYFDLFDENGFDPDPISTRTEDDDLVWEFEPPKGDTLEISFDARIEPAVQLAWKDATTAVLVDDKPVVSATYRTFVMP